MGGCVNISYFDRLAAYSGSEISKVGRTHCLHDHMTKLCQKCYISKIMDLLLQQIV
jgi:hypothetical protein